MTSIYGMYSGLINLRMSIRTSPASQVLHDLGRKQWSSGGKRMRQMNLQSKRPKKSERTNETGGHVISFLQKQPS